MNSRLFLQARNYTQASRKPGDVLWIVLHSAELAEKPTAAEALAKWCAGPNAPRASWHYAVDPDSVTQSVLEEDVAWAAPGANRQGIHIELAGYARQTAEQWDDPPSRALLELAGELVADICTRWSIPVRYVASDALRASEPGITTHWQVTKAFRRSTHTDPGAAFPMGAFVASVRERQFALLPVVE